MMQKHLIINDQNKIIAAVSRTYLRVCLVSTYEHIKCPSSFLYYRGFARDRVL